MAGDDISPQLLDRDWALVNPYASAAVDALIPGGMEGSVETLRDRLRPDALLIVRQYMDLENTLWTDWQKATDVAERVLSALNLLFLISPVIDLTLSFNDGASIRSMPVPLWLTRVPDRREPAYIFGRDRFYSHGDSQRLSWPAFTMMTHNPLTMSMIDSILAKAPSIVCELLAGSATPSFKSAARTLMLSFNSTTVGQFVSQSLSSLDILFGEGENTKWKEMQRYIQNLCGKNTDPELVKSVLNQRHLFIHRHEEPRDGNASQIALAVVISAFMGWAELLETHLDRTATLDVLEACVRLTQASKRGNPKAIEALNIIQPSLPLRPQWVKDWLAENPRPAA
jgi:hypothetical protein